MGYAGGLTPPHYREVCSGMTGHNEVVLVVFDPKVVDYHTLLRVFWKATTRPKHAPRQRRRTQYRSGIYCYGAQQQALALATRDSYQQALRAQGFDLITTESSPPPSSFYAEDYISNTCRRIRRATAASAAPRRLAI